MCALGSSATLGHAMKRREMSRDFPRWIDPPGWHEQDQAKRERRAQAKRAKQLHKEQQQDDRRKKR